MSDMDEELGVYPCGYCNASFPDTGSLLSHVAASHSDEATSSSSSSNALRLRCSHCSRRFFTRSRLEIHETQCVASSHFSCEPCGAHFKTEDTLRNHIAATHPQGSKAALKKGTHGKSSAEPPWQCAICGKVFPFRTRLRAHEEVHKDSGERVRKHKCSQCGKSFFRSGDLWAHNKIHTGSKYNCEVCGKAMSSSGSLHNHRLLHDSSKHLMCPICGKTFAFRQKYDNHLLQHEGKKPFECLTCGEGFTHKQSLVAHNRRQHRSKDLSEAGACSQVLPRSKLKCKICGKEFNDQLYLNRHYKWHRRVQYERKREEQDYNKIIEKDV